MELIHRKITEEWYSDENIINKETSETTNDFNNRNKQMERNMFVLQNQIKHLYEELEEVKSLLLKSEEKPQMDSSVLINDDAPKRKMANCNQKPFKRFVYSNYEFQSTGRYSGKVMFDISDVVRLSKLIDNVEKFPTMKLLKENVAPFLSNNTFAKLVYNYQEGFFKDYLSEYYNNIKFTICNNHLCIDGMDTKLRPDEVWDIVNLLINSSNHYECVDNLVKQYSKTKPLFIKIITDFASDGRLSRLLHPPLKQVKIENNPEKRREMGL